MPGLSERGSFTSTSTSAGFSASSLFASVPGFTSSSSSATDKDSIDSHGRGSERGSGRGSGGRGGGRTVYERFSTDNVIFIFISDIGEILAKNNAHMIK
jgi:hypothetical protein